MSGMAIFAALQISVLLILLAITFVAWRASDRRPECAWRQALFMMAASAAVSFAVIGAFRILVQGLQP